MPFPAKLPIKPRPFSSVRTIAPLADSGDDSDYLPPLAAKARPQSLKVNNSTSQLDSYDTSRVEKRRKVERPAGKVEQWRAKGGDRGATDSTDDPRHDALLESISHFLPSFADNQIETGRPPTARTLSAEELAERAYERLRASVGEVDGKLLSLISFQR